MADLPTGTVTFLFTDIEGSTRLLKQLGARYGEVLADHEQILRDAFDAHRGRIVDTQGDSFFVVFVRAGDAVASAIDAQRALEHHAWPEGVQVKVRMGLHSGEPRAEGERYVGFGVHRAARVGSVGHGGQILLSNATRELVEDQLPSDARLRDLGSYRLKDLERPEHLFQLEAEGLPDEFPPLTAPPAARPHQLRRLGAFAAVIVAIAAVSGAVAMYLGRSTEPPAGSVRNPVTVLSPWEGGEETAFVKVLEAFERKTGFTTQVEEAPNFLGVLQGRLAAENPPMLAMIPTSGMLVDLVREGAVQPLAELGISDTYLHQNYGSVWVDHGTVDGEAYAFPAKASSKSLIWYRPDDFKALGLAVPRTWTQLLSVSNRIKAAGETPWSLGAQDSWTLTDWFENIYIRTAGPEKYRQLFAGELRFDHGSVTATLRRMTSILDDRYVAGGISGALETDLGEAIVAVFGDNPNAHLYMEGGFVGNLALQYIEPTPRPGRTIGLAPFPTIDPSVGSPLVGGSNLAAAFVDNDAVRELLLYLSSPEAAGVWVSTGAVVSPNKRVPQSAYPNVLVRGEAQQLIGATVLVSDGSDLLPGMLAEDWGTTLQQVIKRPADMPDLLESFQRKAARAFNG